MSTTNRSRTSLKREPSGASMSTTANSSSRTLQRNSSSGALQQAPSMSTTTNSSSGATRTLQRAPSSASMSTTTDSSSRALQRAPSSATISSRALQRALSSASISTRALQRAPSSASISITTNSSSRAPQQQVTSKYHGHPLTWNDQDNTPRVCNGCRELCFKGRYECTSRSIKCDFYLHRECISPINSHVGFFTPGRVFEFREYLHPSTHPNPCCTACGRNVKGFVYYYSGNNCRLYLHPSCTALPRMLRSGSRNLSLRAELSSSTCCYECGEGNYSGRRSWWYVSSPTCASNHIHDRTCGVEPRHFHVACLNKIRQDYWTRSSGREEERQVTDREAQLQIAVTTTMTTAAAFQGRRSNKLEKYLKLLKFVLNIIMALTGLNPTGLVTDIITELWAN